MKTDANGGNSQDFQHETPSDIGARSRFLWPLRGFLIHRMAAASYAAVRTSGMTRPLKGIV
jgi:hypothetical protein